MVVASSCDGKSDSTKINIRLRLEVKINDEDFIKLEMTKINTKNYQTLIKYHPARFSGIRESCINELMQILQTNCQDDIHPIFSLSEQVQQKMYHCLVKFILNDVIASKPKELYPTHVKKMFKMCELAHLLSKENGYQPFKDYLDVYHEGDLILFQHYTSFYYFGSNIFEFPRELLEFFAQTTVDSVLVDDIRLPFGSIYIHFGKQDNRQLYGNISLAIETLGLKHPSQEDIYFLLDGVYVSQCPDTNGLKITFTSVKNKSSKYTTSCLNSYEDVLDIVLPSHSEDKTIGELTEAIKNQYFVGCDNRKPRITSTEILKQISDYFKLVINCLLYLQSYPEDIVEDYPNSAPVNLVSRTKSSSVVKNKAESKLNQLGYRKIKFCGKNSSILKVLEDEATETTNNPQTSRSPHKRRAHLRKQRYGKGFELCRYIWIKESTIHKDKYYQSPQRYRIYEMGDGER